ncbi:MAG: phage tail tube protein [Caldilineaceae bacterium]
MAKFAGIDVTLGVDDGASGYTEIAQVRDISGPPLSLRTFELACRSAATNWVEVIAGLLDAGELTLEIAFDPDDATHKHTGTTGIMGLMIARTLTSFQMAFPDATPTTWTFNAYVSGFAIKAPLEGGLTADLKLRISGGLTIA